MTLSKFIKKRRKELNITQLQMALEMGFTNGQYISNVERGLCSWPIKRCAQLAQILRTPKSEIINMLKTEKMIEIMNSSKYQW